MDIDNENAIRDAKKIITSKTGLCIAGGGVLGEGEIGALDRWVEHGGDLKNITHVVGASVGGFTGAIIAAGGDLEYIKNKMGGIDMRRFQDGPNIFTKFFKFFKHFGWYNGDAITDFIGEVLHELVGDSDITMIQLYERSKVHLTLVYNSLNFKAAFYVDHITEPNTKVKDAVRMGAGYPFCYKPIFRRYLKHDGTYGYDVIVDGGTIDNYPLHVLREQGLLDSQIIGLKLCSSDEVAEYHAEAGSGLYDDNTYDFGEPTNLEEFGFRLVDLMRSAAMKMHVKSNDWILTAKINVANLSSTDFDISVAQKRYIFEAGQKSIDQLIADTAKMIADGTYMVL